MGWLSSLERLVPSHPISADSINLHHIFIGNNYHVHLIISKFLNVHRTAVIGVTRIASTLRPATQPRAWKHRCCRRTPKWYRPGQTRNVSYLTGTWCAISGMAGPGFRRPTAARSAPAARPSWPRAIRRQPVCKQSSSLTKTHPTRCNTG